VVRLSWIVRVGAELTRCPQVILVLLALPDLPVNVVGDHPVSPLDSTARELSFKKKCLKSYSLHFIHVARICGDRTGDVCVRVCLTVAVDVYDSRSENPFNYDLNDLDLDDFCFALQRDLHEITAVRLLTSSKLIFTF